LYDPRSRDVTVHEIDLQTLAGAPATLGDFAGSAVLVVNVASQCGLTPQYEGLQRLQDRFAERGFTVAGFPCNQFGAQEPGTAEEIGEFCLANYGVTFPMFAKIDVNGADRHPLYAELTQAADAEGKAGDIQWNFEKFLVGPDGKVIARFRPLTDPEAPEVIEAIEASLAG
jgi:glutathione peroxidase